MPVDLKRETQFGDPHQEGTIDLATSQQFLRSRYSLSQLVLLNGRRGLKSFGVVIEPLASFDYFDTLIEIRDSRDLSVKAEAI